MKIGNLLAPKSNMCQVFTLKVILQHLPVSNFICLFVFHIRNIVSYWKLPMENNGKYLIPNLQNAIQLVEMLAIHPEGLSLAELVQHLKLAKTTIFRITQTLQYNNYLYKDEESHCFFLTRKFMRIGLSALGEQSLVENSLIHMRALRDEIKESVLLGAMMETEVVLLEQVMGTHPFTFYLQPGKHFNLHASAPGKVLLAYSDKKERELTINRLELERFNERTITSVKDLNNELITVEEKGYGIDHAEEMEGVHCISAPIFNQNGSVLAAIWTTAPSSRLPVSEFENMAKQVTKCALKISATFGYNLLKNKEN